MRLNDAFVFVILSDKYRPASFDYRDILSKYLLLIPEDQSVKSPVEKVILDYSKKNSDAITEEIHPSSPGFVKPKPANSGISPAKIAQAERESSTESDHSESSDEDQTFTERSRPVMRSATPRRSASPMRRVQIGRSGSRRSTALTIKSLNYFPPRERITSNRDGDENNSGDEQADQPAKKSENTVRRMSVQEAISLFENKQKDQKLDVQKGKASGEVSLNTNKTVLRRWSSGISDSLTRDQDQENASEAISEASAIVDPDSGDNSKSTDVKTEFDISASNLKIASETTQLVASPETQMMATLSKDCLVDSVSSHAEGNADEAAAPAEWNRQKEVELNQILMKMVESKQRKYQGPKTGSARSLSSSNEQRGGFYSQYKAKRDERFRAENVQKHSLIEEQFKMLQGTIKPSKADLASKGVTAKKLDGSVGSQRPRRNSSPPVLQKKEVSKAAASKKVTPKSSPLPATRSSYTSGPLQKSSGGQSVKSSSRVSSANTTPSRRKSLPISPVPPSPKTERPMHQQKGKPEAKTDVKPSTRGQEEKSKKTTNTKRIVKTTATTASADGSASAVSKPSFYNKVTKKSSVVPLEAKPVKKSVGTGRVAGPVITKSKVNQPDDSSKRSDSSIQAAEIVSSRETTEPTAKVLEVDLPQQANDVDANLVTSLDNDLNLENTENVDQSIAEVDNGNKNSVELPVAEIQPDDDIGISSSAWVEVEHQEVANVYDTGLSDTPISNGLVPPLVSSPRVRHSLSQMLQADSNEQDIIEWGNAENPPALIYHKDAPKGLKRLLKFARKSKGEANVTGWASPSIFSEGEDDTEDSKTAHKKNLDTLRKAALQAKGYGQQKFMLNESFHDGNASKRSEEYNGIDVLSGIRQYLPPKSCGILKYSSRC